MKVAALFVQRGGVYYGLPDVDRAWTMATTQRKNGAKRSASASSRGSSARPRPSPSETCCFQSPAPRGCRVRS